jgi:dTDP-4-dehydrorhamnose 3,5-epimerase
MIFKPSSVFPEVLVIEPELHQDERGFFTEVYHQEKFEAAGIRTRFVQDNRSRSRRGTLRGLHYQSIGLRENWSGLFQGRSSM